jgi:hypothetical protein
MFTQEAPKKVGRNSKDRNIFAAKPEAVIERSLQGSDS